MLSNQPQLGLGFMPMAMDNFQTNPYIMLPGMDPVMMAMMMQGGDGTVMNPMSNEIGNNPNIGNPSQ